MSVSPAQAWAELLAGNERFVADRPLHPRQDAARRHDTAGAQTPHAALFGCSDSRLAAEIIFDRGLGDLFVVRNAGQIVSDSVLASLEYAVAVLEVPLIVVLRHDSCGAVLAAVAAEDPETPRLPPHIAAAVARIGPAIERTRVPGAPVDPDAVGREHLRGTIGEILEGSTVIAEGVAAGTLAVVAAEYRLADGLVTPDVVVGSV